MRTLLPALLLAGCLSQGPAPATGSGIHGVAMLGPTCPAQREPPDPQCADKPFQGNLSVVPAGGSQAIRTFATDAQGEFNVSLAPGDYEIGNAEGSGMPPRCASEGAFTVRAGAWTLVNVSCDTGIR